MDEAFFLELLKYLGLSGAGGVTGAFLLRFAWRKLFEEGAAAQRAVWQAEFIEQLRAEIERLNAVNRQLYDQAADLHGRVIALMTENTELKTELSMLKARTRTQDF